jgi:hypothetical protein
VKLRSCRRVRAQDEDFDEDFDEHPCLPSNIHRLSMVKEWNVSMDRRVVCVVVSHGSLARLCIVVLSARTDGTSTDGPTASHLVWVDRSGWATV